MRFKPRYSLLTLLLLTALVAGGVKLWYGPHHVIEQPRPDVELEYSYVREWGTEKIRHGPEVTRTFQQSQLNSVKIIYFRHGEMIPDCQHEFHDFGNPNHNSKRYLPRPTQAESPLAPAEWHDFQAAVEREQDRLRQAGLQYNEYQGTVFHYFYPRGR